MEEIIDSINIRKVISFIILIAFLSTNILYAAPVRIHPNNNKSNIRVPLSTHNADSTDRLQTAVSLASNTGLRNLLDIKRFDASYSLKEWDDLMEAAVKKSRDSVVNFHFTLIHENRGGYEVAIKIPDPRNLRKDNEKIIVRYLAMKFSLLAYSAGCANLHLWCDGDVENSFSKEVLDRIKGPDYVIPEGKDWNMALANRNKEITYILGPSSEPVKSPAGISPFRKMRTVLDAAQRNVLLAELENKHIITEGAPAYIFSLDVGGTNLKVTILDIRTGKIVNIFEERANHGSTKSYKLFLEQVKGLYSKATKEYPIIAATFDIAGPVDMGFLSGAVSGQVTSLTNYIFKETSHDRLMQEFNSWMQSLGIPVLAINDALALMAGEMIGVILKTPTGEISVEKEDIEARSTIFFAPGTGVAHEALNKGSRHVYAPTEIPHASNFPGLGRVKGRPFGNGETPCAQPFFITEFYKLFGKQLQFDGIGSLSKEQIQLFADILKGMKTNGHIELMSAIEQEDDARLKAFAGQFGTDDSIQKARDYILNLEKESPRLFAELRDLDGPNINVETLKAKVSDSVTLVSFVRQFDDIFTTTAREMVRGAWKKYARNILILTLQARNTQELLGNHIDASLFSGGLLRGSSGRFVKEEFERLVQEDPLFKSLKGVDLIFSSLLDSTVTKACLTDELQATVVNLDSHSGALGSAWLGLLNLARYYKIDGYSWEGKILASNEDINKIIDQLEIDPVDMMRQIQASMEVSGLHDNGRILQVINDSLDGDDAFIPTLIILGKQKGFTEQEVLNEIKKTPAYAAKAYRYELTKAERTNKLDGEELKDAFLRVKITETGIEIGGDSQSPALTPGKGKHLSNLIQQRLRDAQTASFSHFDGINDYFGRFLGLRGYGTEKLAWYNDERFTQKFGDKGLYDLRQSIDELRNFMENILDIEEIDNLLNDGIGANEQYLHRLAQILNQLVDNLGIKFNWQIVDNPSQLPQILENFKDPVTKNVLAWIMSRSGSTTETADLQEILINPNAFLQIINIISWANAGRVKNLTVKVEATGGKVYLIDNTREDIGGRHMLELTDMVFGPLYSSLAIIGYKRFRGEGASIDDAKKKGFAWAEDMLKVYARGIYEANIEMMPKQEATSIELAYKKAVSNVSSKAAIFTRRNFTQGRKKIWMVYPEHLYNFVMEHAQNANEGIAGLAPGKQRNDYIHSFSKFGDEFNDYMELARKCPALYQFKFFIDSNSKEAKAMEEQARLLREEYGVPVQIIEMAEEKIEQTDDGEAIDKKLKHNLVVQAMASVLMQTEIITLSFLEDQDPYSNLSVKTTRESTREAQGIIVERQLTYPDRALSEQERIIFMKDVTEKMAKVKEEKRMKYRKDLASSIKTAQGKIQTSQQEISNVFSEYIEENLEPLAKGLNIDIKQLTGIFLASISKKIFNSNYAEAGGKASELVEVTFEAFDAFNRMGILTKDFSLQPLNNEVTVYKNEDKGIMLSVVCPGDLPQNETTLYTTKDESDLPLAIASYYFNMLQREDRLRTTKYFGLGYMVGDADNKNVGNTQKAVNNALGELGISNFPMVFPRFSHVAIEGMQTLVEGSLLAFLLPSYSFPEGEGELGALMITEGLSLNNAMNIYQFGNAVRMMAIGGTPGLIIRYRNKDQLSWVENVMSKALEILAEKLKLSRIDALYRLQFDIKTSL